MKRVAIITVVAVIMGCVCSCKSKKDNKDAVQDETEMARGKYDAEKNEVTVVPLERKVFNKQLVCNGRLEAQNKVTVQFAAQGTVAEINVRDGQKVQKGQILASLDKEQPKRQLEQARLSFSKAEMTLADRLLDYNYTLADTASIPADQKRKIYINTGFIDARMALENAERTYRDCDLKAPFSGKVASLKGRVHEQGVLQGFQLSFCLLGVLGAGQFAVVLLGGGFVPGLLGGSSNGEDDVRGVLGVGIHLQILLVSFDGALRKAGRDRTPQRAPHAAKYQQSSYHAIGGQPRNAMPGVPRYRAPGRSSNGGGADVRRQGKPCGKRGAI